MTLVLAEVPASTEGLGLTLSSHCKDSHSGRWLRIEGQEVSSNALKPPTWCRGWAPSGGDSETLPALGPAAPGAKNPRPQAGPATFPR